MAEPTSFSGGNLWGKTCAWLARHPYLALTLAVLAALGPFLAKPFNIDDPLFIWAARQIQAHPLDPYGFNVNWYWMPSPMWAVTENPPLAAYYIALAAVVLGWSELALHSAFLLPALAVILGTYRLARRFCKWPMLAALLTLFTPVFMVSSTTVMCDVLMLAFWVWAVVLWVEGMERENLRRLSGAGLLISLAALTKYYGVCLIPLLAAYSLADKRRVGRWAACLLIPLAALCAYQWITQELYGLAMLSGAAIYATHGEDFFSSLKITNALTALTFTGGCLAVAVFFAPLLWRARVIFAGIIVFIAAALSFEGAILKNYNTLFAGGFRQWIILQIVFWAVGGVSLLALALVDCQRQRNARSWLLLLWVVGTFLFAAFFNWVINGRSILPMAPAVGILLVRRLEQNALINRKILTPGMFICFAMGAVLAVLVTQADFLQAIAVRQTAQKTYASFGHEREKLWFEGHWGFQYYMDALGASAVDPSAPVFRAGDFLAVPRNNTNTHFPKSPDLPIQRIIVIQGPSLLATVNAQVGAGFYASLWGPLPFAFCHVPPEGVSVYAMQPIIQKTNRDSP
jgi:4-amino-4-deoxy-L-arabinose transferase-like glycosyltransferase